MEKIKGHACLQIRPAETTQVRITRGLYGGQMLYFGSIKSATFEAVMIPGCSSLNPNLTENQLPYVIQHEQIHFAIMELAARKLTREAREETRNLLAVQPAYREVQAELSNKLMELARAAMEKSMDEHTKFDQDTSMHFNPKWQNWWLQKVEEQLSKTSSEK